VPLSGVSQWTEPVAKLLGGDLPMGFELCVTQKSLGGPRGRQNLAVAYRPAPQCHNPLPAGQKQPWIITHRLNPYHHMRQRRKAHRSWFWVGETYLPLRRSRTFFCQRRPSSAVGEDAEATFHGYPESGLLVGGPRSLVDS